MADRPRFPGPKDAPWDDRLAWIREQMPEFAEDGVWREALRDVESLGAVLKAVLRVDAAEQGLRSVNAEDGAARLNMLLGRDYTTLPFPQAFPIASAGMSLRAVAARCDVTRASLHAYTSGLTRPPLAALESIAKALRKEPSYWLEWRQAYLVAFVCAQIDRHPDLSISAYRSLRRREYERA